MRMILHLSLYLVAVATIVKAEPFFGLKIQGGFKTETDISTAALAIIAPFVQLKQTITTFNNSYPLSTPLLNDAADGVNFLYNGAVNEIQFYTNLLGNSAVDSKSNSTALFEDIKTALAVAQEFVRNTPSELTKISAFSTSAGTALTEAFTFVGSVLNDMSDALTTFEEAIIAVDGNTPITSSSIYKILNKYQLANLIGEIDFLQSQMDIIRAKISNTVSLISTSEGLMKSFIVKLTTAFAALDAPLFNTYSTITKSSNAFQQQLSDTLNQLTSATSKFNDKIKTFTDDIIGANATKIISTTTEFTDFYKYFLDTLMPNSEEKFNSVAYMVTDSVQSAGRDILFNSYQMLNNAIQNLPAASTCATKYLNPLVQSLSNNIPTFSTCLNFVNSQTVASDQAAVLKSLLADRLYYVSLWSNTISGLSSKSDASSRNTAVLKLLAKTPASNVDVHQPALADTYSIFAQIVSNFNALQNRVIMCLTLKSADFSALIIAASNSYFGCIRSS
ncbi:uncharacterized protein LOC131695117 [Topomyia yanbarensis]|uniref:uncharacterized protein LOC131695117 n=1 Tax=Topomyia yanbarensis TaxID=2498891 RepID=UPI00273C72FA|nr:uncharacterized protein LOC131695117 [Topomyia yanbarensis]